MTPLELALQLAETRYAPDDRVTVVDVDAAVDAGTVVLEGAVSTDCIRRGIRREVRRLPGVDGVRTELSVLEGTGVPMVANRQAVPLRATATSDGEQFTQVLYGAV